MKLLIQYINNLYQYSKRKFILNFVFMLLDSLTNGVGILMLIPLLSFTGITGQEKISIPFFGKLITNLHQYDTKIQLIIILTIYLVLIIAQASISRRLNVLNSEIIQGYTKFMRVNLYQGLISSEWAYFSKSKKSDITSIFTNEIVKIASGTIYFLRVLSQLFVAVVQLAVAFMMSAVLTFFVLFCGITVLLLMKSSLLKSKSLGNSLRQINQGLLSEIEEQLNGIKEVKSYGIEAEQLKSFKQFADHVQTNMNAFFKLQAKSSMFYKISAAVVISLLFFFTVCFLDIKPVALIILIYIFAKLWPVFASLQSNLQNIFSMLPSFIALQKNMQELYDHKEALNGQFNQVNLIPLKQSIRFQQICFQYANTENFSLDHINFQIKAYQTTAIVGRSGSGKSTITNLLIGLLKPDEGDMLCDNTIINESNLYLWRKKIGYVPQDAFLFHASIKENLLRFNPSVSDQDIWNALELADCIEFVHNLPLKADTVIGDKGTRLSGGQRQRLVLARALLRKPDILILDEATSSLDNESEFKIQHTLDHLHGKLTMIIIAHRLSTIQNANHILVVDNGKIVEEGDYNSLLSIPDGYFHKLVNMIK